MFDWMLMDICLSEFENYQVAVAPSCFKTRTNSRFPDLFQKSLSGVQSDIYLVRRNIGSTGKYFLAYKNYIQSCTEINTLPELQ